MDYTEEVGRRQRIIGSAAARLASRKWACPECADVSGCRSGSRRCQSCSPPRNPGPRVNLEDL